MLSTQSFCQRYARLRRANQRSTSGSFGIRTYIYGGLSYAVPAGASNQLTAPLAINNYYGGFITQLTVLNAGDNPSNVTVNIYSDTGVKQNGASKTLTLHHIPAMLDQSDRSYGLPSGFNGWAQISGGNSDLLVAQVLEQNANNRFVALVNAQATPQTTLYAAAIFHNAFGGFVTGSNIVNPNGISVKVTVTYYSSNGMAIATASFYTGCVQYCRNLSRSN